MGMYVDLDTGSLRPVPADPETVARMCGMEAKDLMYGPENCSRGMFVTDMDQLR
jgi:hypothetical protein